MDIGIRGRKAIIKGGSAGLGYGAALALAREGVSLTIAARNAARLHDACARIAKDSGVDVTPVTADHSTLAGRELILDACSELDIMVATCSPPPYTPDWRGITSEAWRSGIETGLLSPIEFYNAGVGGMIARGWGRIVHISTGAATYTTVPIG